MPQVSILFLEGHMKKHPEITDATRQAFVGAFLKLGRKKPIERISVKELSEAAGYNRTTFYNYFTDVYSLYEYIENYVFENMRAQIEENIRNPADRESFVRNVVKLTSEWKGYLAVVLSNPYGYHFSVQVKSGLIKYWTEELGLPKDDIKTSYMLDSYMSAVFSVVNRWVRNQDDMTAEEMADLLREIASGGLLKGVSRPSSASAPQG
jgi:AcrR family transcriptional regulator